MATTSTDLGIEELERHEVIKLYQNQDSYLSHKIKSYDLTNSKQSPCKHLQKQFHTQIAKQKNYVDINKLQLPSVNPQTFEVFTIENLESIFPSNYKNRWKNKPKQSKYHKYWILHKIYQSPQQWKNDDLHRWISFGKSRANRFRCSCQKDWFKKHRNQNCTCSHENGHQLSLRNRINKNRNNICHRKHQHFYRKPTLDIPCPQPLPTLFFLSCSLGTVSLLLTMDKLDASM